MQLDPAAIGQRTEPKRVDWTAKDCALYALGVGASVDELAFTTDNTHDVPQRMLPTMPVTLGLDGKVYDFAGGLDWTKVVHAAQSFDLAGEVPVDGTALATSRIVEMWDKGKAAVVVTETEARDESSGNLLFTTRSSLFIRGAGGWGGDRGPSVATPDLPETPTVTVAQQTREDQALIYRLSGDRNPLHSDPWFAQRAGFDRPILHGLCTYGFTGRALLNSVAGGNPAQIRSMSARFASPVFPGDQLTVEIWTGSDGVRFQTRRDDGTVVLSDGELTLATDS